MQEDIPVDIIFEHFGAGILVIAVLRNATVNSHIQTLLNVF